MKRTQTPHASPLAALACCVVAAFTLGCGPSVSAGPGTVNPGGPGTKDGPAPLGEQEGETVPELQKRLDRLRGEHEARTDDAMADTKACHDLCSLSASICEVQVKLCDIADRRPQEGTYQDLCREAQQECHEAQTSCENCVGEHEGDNVTMPPE